MTVETFFTNFGHLADAPNGVQKLRELILLLAVQGKLVIQDPKDEPASTALDQIQKKRKKLIKEKMIRKQTELEPISVNELPYSIPQVWAWTRLGELVVSQTDDFVDGPFGSNLKAAEYQDSGVPIIRIQNIDRNRFKDKQIKFVTPEKANQLKRHSFVAGDIVINKLGAPVGKACIVPPQFESGIIVADLVRIRLNEKLFETRYVTYAINSGPVISQFTGEITGITRDRVNLTKMRSLLFPLPPLEEQKRIVAKVDQLMALCDELEARQQKQQQGRVRLNNAALDALLTARKPIEFADHWQRISTNFDLLYDHPEPIAKLRAAILQLAVQGKLVPQDPNDEPASVLLERIKAEKERLVQERKVKKQKPLPVLDEELAPFDLPSGWAWARFPEVGEFGRGKSKRRPRNDPSLYSGGKYPMVQTGDVARANGEVKTYTALYNDTGLAQSRLWPKGTMCITIAANIADSAVLGFDACFPDSVVGLIASEEIGDVTYFEYFIRTAKEHLMDFAPSTAQKNINLGILETVFIPLPPLAEMKRIVAKVDQLMALCDELEAKLNQAQQHSEKLMEATVRQLWVG